MAKKTNEFHIHHLNNPMTENKLYAQCREEAYKQINEKQSIRNCSLFDGFKLMDELSQLTAEIYGMKLLDMTADELYLKSLRNGWELHKVFEDLKIIGTTQQLHDHFVEQFNKEVGK